MYVSYTCKQLFTYLRVIKVTSASIGAVKRNFTKLRQTDRPSDQPTNPTDEHEGL